MLLFGSRVHLVRPGTRSRCAALGLRSGSLSATWVVARLGCLPLSTGRHLKRRVPWSVVLFCEDMVGVADLSAKEPEAKRCQGRRVSGARSAGEARP